VRQVRKSQCLVGRSPACSLQLVRRRNLVTVQRDYGLTSRFLLGPRKGHHDQQITSQDLLMLVNRHGLKRCHDVEFSSRFL
jgi:hypothetical protein